MIATVDKRLGKFVKMLEAEGMRDNTILVFLTDNGTANGEKIHNAGMRGKKGSLYEGGHRVPCWISWPNGHLCHASDVNTLTQCQDLLPTLIDLCGLKKKPEYQMDGSSLAPLLRGKLQSNLNNRILVYQHNENKGNGLVMQDKWRLVKDELYHITDDPSQTTNIAQKHPDVVERLKAHYEKWWKSVEPHLDLEPYRLGVTDDEDMLTAYDWWYGRRVYNWPHLRRGDRSNGRYFVSIERGGNYRISLRRWPRESGLMICDAVERYVPTDSYMAFDKKHAPFPPGKGVDVVEAKIRFGNQEQRIPVTPDSQEVVLNFYVPQGKTTLQTWFIDKEGKEFGANYVYILRK
jgi:hypothetical protein